MGVLQTLPLAWVSPKVVLPESLYNFEGFRDGNLPGGKFQDCLESALDKPDLLQRGLELSKFLLNKLLPPQNLKQMKA